MCKSALGHWWKHHVPDSGSVLRPQPDGSGDEANDADSPGVDSV